MSIHVLKIEPRAIVDNMSATFTPGLKTDNSFICLSCFGFLRRGDPDL